MEAVLWGADGGLVSDQDLCGGMRGYEGHGGSGAGAESADGEETASAIVALDSLNIMPRSLDFSAERLLRLRAGPSLANMLQVHCVPQSLI